MRSIILCLLALLAVAHATISPIVKCTVRSGSMCAARWGYDNDGDLAFVPLGEENSFSQVADFMPEDSQPVRFEPGRHELVFQTTWRCAFGPLQWTLDDGGGLRTATALHVGTCDCGTGCLSGVDVSASVAENSVRYDTSGGDCDVSHFILDLDGCEPLHGERTPGSCAPPYLHPFKIDGDGGNLTFEEPVTFALGEITLKGGSACSPCETFVPVCQSPSTTSSIAPTTSTTSSSVTTTSTSITAFTTSSVTLSTSSVTFSTSSVTFSTSSVSSSVTSSTDLASSSISTSAQPLPPKPKPKPKPSPPDPIVPPAAAPEDEPDPRPAQAPSTVITTGDWVVIGVAIGLGALSLLCCLSVVFLVMMKRRDGYKRE